MTWPNPNEYVEAIQNPKQAFSNAELQQARVVTNKLGLPRPISGNFATVFEVENNSRKWAVRCFLREVNNQQQRYAAITAHLQKHHLTCMVGFEYLPQGIKVKGQWYPILKMDWTAGSRLDIYLEANLQNPQKLQKLADQWLKLCQLLRQANIAHGDLQHGNILVTTQDEIKLIDYDGVFIAPVIGLPSNEIGHRHYQHPSRTSDKSVTSSNYQNIDNFSMYVIGLSLFALSIDGALWQKTKAGEENLLFRDDDYKDPEHSATLSLLQKHRDERVRQISQRMEQLIASPSYLEVPAFEKLETGLGVRAKDWLNDHLTKLKGGNPPPVTGTRPPAWVMDHLQTSASSLFDFSNEFVLAEKQAIETEFQSFPLRGIRILYRLFAASYIRERFSGYPVASRKVQLEATLAVLEKNILKVQGKFRAISQQYDDEKASLEDRIKQAEIEIDQLTTEIDTIRKQEKDEIAQLDANQIQQYYQSYLSQYEIAPNRIPGIGPARISALHSVGIHTAADILPVNRGKAYMALRQVRNASPLPEWQALEQWCEQLKLSMPKPFPKSSSPAAVKNIIDKYADHSRDLVRQRDLKKQQLKQIAHPSNAQHIRLLNQELDSLQTELNDLTGQSKQLKSDLKRYEKITQANLLDLILKS